MSLDHQYYPRDKHSYTPLDIALLGTWVPTNSDSRWRTHRAEMDRPGQSFYRSGCDSPISKSRFWRGSPRQWAPMEKGSSGEVLWMSCFGPLDSFWVHFAWDVV